ncbi:hypothetical protein EIKCOROL_00044 [Eikenella corrodens ATCC 23834]|uniref:Uncharacterized protein n=1 Tax=Eikenella corrodens ATCC 23834 TaxID=546274 RepID=C0DRS9_EIKCO|nr:hypothetical protein EIKCOROL_00044 [Eikenella corrodens ATCC 23834]
MRHENSFERELLPCQMGRSGRFSSEKAAAGIIILPRLSETACAARLYKQACGGKVNFINRFVKLSPWRASYYFLIIRAHFCALVSTSLKLTLSGSLYV